MAPLQKRAWWGLGVGLAFGIALLLVFIIKGDVTTFNEDLSYRLTVSALWAGGLIAYLIVMSVTLRRRGQIDERDRLILDRATKTQLWALVITMVAWTLSLTEIYWDKGSIPIIYLYLIFMSVQIVNTIAQSLGIIIGYWRMN